MPPSGRGTSEPDSDSVLADAHNLPDDLPGDELGGGFENGEQFIRGTGLSELAGD